MPVSSAHTRLVALLGDPVGHSLSPAFQNAAFRAADLDAVYLALRCDAARFPGLMHGIAAAGGAGNVTIPHKEAAAALVQRPSAAVQRTGACNTFWHEAGALHGDNTDVAGAAAALCALLGGPVTGLRVLLLGAGGAARAALCALLDQQAAEVAICNRSVHRAAELAERFADPHTRVHAVRTRGDLRGTQWGCVVNATSVGLRPGDPLPLSDEAEVRADAALDLVYTPQETEWVRRLRARGVPAADGLEMLLQQGAAAFGRWWDRPAPLAAMRAALPARA